MMWIQKERSCWRISTDDRIKARKDPGGTVLLVVCPPCRRSSMAASVEFGSS